MSAIIRRRIYVGNIPRFFRDTQLTEYFSQFGKVLSANVVNFAGTTKSRGFGFVKFADDETTDKVLAMSLEAQGHKLVLTATDPDVITRESKTTETTLPPVNDFGFNGFIGKIDLCNKST
eukprot:c8843_g1_i2.p1 GENE.c8843_g1_i2~~c8843_g1_i2.p1  ORF type:complete len:132 (+),score=24.99 c8843_g1_i2:38-397(+)